MSRNIGMTMEIRVEFFHIKKKDDIILLYYLCIIIFVLDYAKVKYEILNNNQRNIMSKIYLSHFLIYYKSIYNEYRKLSAELRAISTAR